MQKGYIGTYTNGESRGIYSFILEAGEGAIKNICLAAEAANPTYLTVSPDNKSLFSVMKEGENGGLAAFSIKNDGLLEIINTQLLPGSPPCHVSIDRNMRRVFSANYHKGTVESHLIEGGAIQPASSIIKHEGSGPDPRQEKAHTHFAGLTPDERFLAAVDLGTDALLTYKVNGDASLEKNHLLPLKAGSGPRHLAFHPNGRWAYVMTEFSSEVIVLEYHPETGQFTEKQYISTLPAHFTENNQGSAIHVSADGRFVYAGNRGHDSIAVFRVMAGSGELEFIEHTSTEGNWPRDFAIDPSGKFLLASNQESSNLTLFSRDEGTGRLTLLQKNIPVPNPVCVKFLHG